MTYFNISKNHSFLAFLTSFLIALFLLTGCDDDIVVIEDDEFIITGISAIGAPIADARVDLRSQDGSFYSSMTDDRGVYTVPNVVGQGAYLARVELGDNRYFYSIGYAIDATTLTINLHPFTDLILKNWFAVQNMDITSVFDSANSEFSLPTQDELNGITQEVKNIIALTLNVFFPDGSEFDLFSSPFVADSRGFDQFLDFSNVTIANETIYFSSTSLNRGIESPLITNIPLDLDFTSDNDTPPSQPENTRAGVSLIDDDTGEILVAWNSSVDDKGIAGYQVFRNGELVDETPYPFYIDSNLPLGNSYSYEIIAFDGRAQQSPLSLASTPVTLSLPDTTAPDTPFNLVTSASSSTIELNWSQTAINDVFGFRITRNGNQEYAFVSDTQFFDTNVNSEEVYCYSIIAVDAAGNASAESNQVCDSLDGDTDLSNVSFYSTNLNVFESSGVATITVARLGNTSEAIAVDYNVSPLSATDGKDFSIISGRLHWQAGESIAKSFDIPIIADELAEENETILLSLTSPSIQTSLGQHSTATLTIVNEDTNCTPLENTNITDSITLESNCYYVNTDLEVSNGATLTLTPNTKLLFNSGVGFTVRNDGVLNAQGEAGKPITLTGIFSNTGDWKGIDIQSNDTSYLHHTVVEFGGQSTNNEVSANIRLSNGGTASIEQSISRYSAGYGIQLTAEETLISFSENLLNFNQAAPISIDINAIGDLAVDNIMLNNFSSQDEDQNYIWVTGNTMTDEQTWPHLTIPYRFAEPVLEIEAPITLSPGITIEMPKEGKLHFRNAATVVGTQEQPITFTGVEKERGYWDSIVSLWGAHDREFRHVIIEYGGAIADDNTQGAFSIFCNSDALITLNDSTLRHNSAYALEHRSRAKLNLDNVNFVNNRKSITTIFNKLEDFTDSNNYKGDDTEGIYIFGNKIQKDITLVPLEVDYLIYDFHNKVIDIEANLTLLPGTGIRIRRDRQLNVTSTGSITAQGTADRPITISGSRSEKGFWNGINIVGSDNSNNIFDHVVVEDGGNANGDPQGLIAFRNSDTSTSQGTVSNTTFRNSTTAGLVVESGATVNYDDSNSFEEIDGEDISTP